MPHHQRHHYVQHLYGFISLSGLNDCLCSWTVDTESESSEITVPSSQYFYKDYWYIKLLFKQEVKHSFLRVSSANWVSFNLLSFQQQEKLEVPEVKLNIKLFTLVATDVILLYLPSGGRTVGCHCCCESCCNLRAKQKFKLSVRSVKHPTLIRASSMLYQGTAADPSLVLTSSNYTTMTGDSITWNTKQMKDCWHQISSVPICSHINAGILTDNSRI